MAAGRCLRRHGAAIEIEAARSGRDQRAGAARRIALARDHDRAPQAVQRRRDIEQCNDRRDKGAIARDHLPDQAEAPQQDERKNPEPGEDQPSEQGAAVTKRIKIAIRRWHPDTSTSPGTPTFHMSYGQANRNRRMAIRSSVECTVSHGGRTFALVRRFGVRVCPRAK